MKELNLGRTWVGHGGRLKEANFGEEEGEAGRRRRRKRKLILGRLILGRRKEEAELKQNKK